MNELQRLEAALRAAHEAGDEEAAARFAQAIRALQSSSAAPSAPATAPAAPSGFALAPAVPRSTGAPPAPPKPATTPRAEGRAFAKERGAIGAAIQGAGSAVFGLGTPAAAVDEYIRSRVNRDQPRSWQESLEFARGLREGSKKEHPYAYAGGFLGSMVGEAKVITSAASKAPAVVRNIFALQKGQTIRNLARLSATGAATAATTATVQEGTDATVPAAAAGAVLGPAGAGVVKVIGAGASRAASLIKPDNAAIRILAKKLGEPADAIAARYNEFTATMGRRPRLVEIMLPEAAGEMGQISASKVGIGAGRVFQKAEDAAAAARPGELRSLVERGGRTTTVPEQTAELAPITAEARRVVNNNVKPGALKALTDAEPIINDARRVVNSRVRSTETAQLARRDAAMDQAMERIHDHRVPVSEEIQAVLEHPDIQGVLPAALRRSINQRIQDGQDLGSIDIPVRIWEMMRYEMAKRAGGPGASQIYSQYRDRIRDYVSERVPEYASALREFGRRSTGAEATVAAERAVAGSAREFADMLRAAGTGVNGNTARATTRVGVRNWLSNQLSGTPQQAERTMARLARDGRLRANLQATLSDAEMQQLSALGERYGHRLNVIEGAKIGSDVLTSESKQFAEAVRAAAGTPGGMEGVREGARIWLSNQLSGTPEQAERAMAHLAQNKRLLSNLRAALSREEMQQLSALGEQYGHRLNIIEGVKVGSKILTGDSERFEDAVRAAAAEPGGAVGVRTGARGALAAKAGESPASAVATARAVAENPGLQRRLTVALGGSEAGNLEQVGAVATRAAQNLAAAAPRKSEAQLRASAQAQEVQEIISGLIIAGGRFSGAFLANFVNNITQRTKMSKGVATRLAEMATDPENAHIFISRMKAAGIREDELLHWYQAAAGASGIFTGAAVGK